MDSKPFTFQKNDGFVTVMLSQPDSGNRLLTEDIRALGRTIRELGEKADVKTVVIRAQGDAFCLGRQPAVGAQAPKSAIAIRDDATQPILGLYADVRATPVPVLAVVHGEARGFGCALVGQCDLAIAVESARFSLPELETNLPPTLAISAVLGKVPPKRLLHMVYSRRQIDAHVALTMGLLSEVVARLDLESAVARTLAELTSRSRSALCAVKEYMAVAPYTDPLGASRLAANMLSVVLSSPEAG